MKPRKQPARLVVTNGQGVSVRLEYKETPKGWGGILRKPSHEPRLATGQTYPIRLGDGRSGMIRIEEVSPKANVARFVGEGALGRQTAAAK